MTVAEAARSGLVFDPAAYFDGIGAVLAGTANVIMQLANPPVGYGVLESKVDSGQAMRHPVKRARTTFTYLAVAWLGDDTDRANYRDAVNTSHRLVRSDATSPVRYNAFDPNLQLWVAACLYYGTVDIIERLHGPLAADEADALYAHAARYGTTLQVPPGSWPGDRAEFAGYWERQVGQISIDEPVRRYLHALVRRQNLPRPLRSGRVSQWLTTGFLPPPFRAAMGYPWTADDEARFTRLLRAIGRVERRLPGPVRVFPFNLLLRDMRRRVRRGRPLV